MLHFGKDQKYVTQKKGDRNASRSPERRPLIRATARKQDGVRTLQFPANSDCRAEFNWRALGINENRLRC